MEKVIGIDLGTTNSCVAIVEAGAPQVIPNRGGYKTTPSMVAITEAGKRLVGHIAKRQAITNAENTVYAAKRLIGRKWSSPQVKNAIATSSYRIVEGPHHDCRVVLRDKEYGIPEISAMVLQEMKVIAEDYLGHSVSKALLGKDPSSFMHNLCQFADLLLLSQLKRWGISDIYKAMKNKTFFTNRANWVIVTSKKR